MLFLSRRHHEAAQFSQSNTGSDLARLYNAPAGAAPFEDFDAEEHRRNLELLLSQERVVALIYARTFPIAPRAGVAGAAGGLTGGDRGASRTVAIGMPSRPVAMLGRTAGYTSGGAGGGGGGGGGNNGRASPTENLLTTGEGAGLFGSGSEDTASNRPQTTGAITSTSTSANLRSEMFPAIASATNQPAARLASR